MRHLVKTADDLPEILHVAGVAVRFDERDQIARAAMVVLCTLIELSASKIGLLSAQELDDKQRWIKKRL